MDQFPSGGLDHFPSGATTSPASSRTLIFRSVKYGVFGKNLGGSDEKPPWSPTEFTEWAEGEEGLTRELTALYNLLCGFRLTTFRANTIRVSPGKDAGDSKFTLQFTAKFDAGTEVRTKSKFIYTPASEKGPPSLTQQRDPTDPEDTGVWSLEVFSSQKDDLGRDCFEITYLPLVIDASNHLVKASALPLIIRECSCSVQYESSEAGFRLPRSGPLPYQMYPGGALGGLAPEKYSKDQA